MELSTIENESVYEAVLKEAMPWNASQRGGGRGVGRDGRELGIGIGEKETG